jgi:hypothetical protein
VVLDNWLVEIARVEEADIGFVRRMLDDLAVARSICGWSDADRDRYMELCECERSLLVATQMSRPAEKMRSAS